MSEELKNSPIADFDWDAYEKGETKRDKSFEELEKTYDNSLNKFQEDEVTEGTVISINKREVVVNIGAKSDGIIPVSEFRYNPDLKVGDTPHQGWYDRRCIWHRGLPARFADRRTPHPQL